MKVGIVGYGHVGKAMHNLFKDAVLYDKYLNIGTMKEINECDIAFVCVPTPRGNDGSCNTCAVEEVIEWVKSDVIVLRSTVPVGFTEKMKEKYKKNIVFQPEYYGETVAHPFADLSDRKWLSFGGSLEDISKVIKAYQKVLTSNINIYQYPAKEVELAKYIENAFLAMKVTFCNEIFDIAKALNVNYDVVREVWLADPRIGRSHTFVYEDNRGYGGSCLPKDISSLIFQAEFNGADATLLKAVVEKNETIRKSNA